MTRRRRKTNPVMVYFREEELPALKRVMADRGLDASTTCRELVREADRFLELLAPKGDRVSETRSVEVTMSESGGATVYVLSAKQAMSLYRQLSGFLGEQTNVRYPDSVSVEHAPAAAAPEKRDVA